MPRTSGRRASPAVQREGTELRGNPLRGRGRPMGTGVLPHKAQGRLGMCRDRGSRQATPRGRALSSSSRRRLRRKAPCLPPPRPPRLHALPPPPLLFRASPRRPLPPAREETLSRRRPLCRRRLSGARGAGPRATCDGSGRGVGRSASNSRRSSSSLSGGLSTPRRT